MKATLRGTRGSISVAGPDTSIYGGDTASVELITTKGELIVLDAGSGIRDVTPATAGLTHIDILLTHLHMDHVQGLPFFGPLLDADVEVHVWGPMSTMNDLRTRISRYLSPPLFPVRVRELPNVSFFDVPPGTFSLGSVKVTADLISHPGETLGFRIEESGSVLTYMPDHEPALGVVDFPESAEWTSGFALADGADILIHDAQYTDDEYANRMGWGHTSHSQLLAFGQMAGVERLVTFHHDPAHIDEQMDQIHDWMAKQSDGMDLVPGKVGLAVEL